MGPRATFLVVGRLPVSGSAGQEEKLGEAVSHIAKIVKKFQFRILAPRTRTK